MAGHDNVLDALQNIPSHPRVISKPEQELIDPIAEAWMQQCRSLPKEVQEEFESRACDGLVNLVAKVEAACKEIQETSSRVKVIEWLSPLFDFILLFGRAASITVNADPTPASLIVGGIVAVVEAAQRIPQYLRLTLQMLTRMGHTVKATVEYGTSVYKEEPSIQLAIVEVWGDILSFCLKAFEIVTEGTKSKVRLHHLGLSAVRSFDTRLGTEVRKFEKDLEALELKICVCDRKRLQQILQGLTAQNKAVESMNEQIEKSSRRYEEVQQKIEKRDRDLEDLQERSNNEKQKVQLLRWLSPVNFLSSYHRRCDEHLEETGYWLFESDAYKQWRSSMHSDVLWIHGKPGCGKSVLAALAISELSELRGPDTAIAYAFCERGRDSFHDATEILRALAAQICRQQTGINTVLQDEAEAYSPGDPPTLRTTRNAINAATSQLRNIFIVVDALDECSDNQMLVTELGKLVEDADATVKIIVFSRTEFYIEQAFQDFNQIQLDNGANDRDLSRYVSNLFPNDSNLEINSKMRKQIMRNAEGMFLWVKLLHQSVDKPLNEKQKLDRLRDVPKGLKSLYDRILANIWAKEEDISSTASLVLFWTICGVRTLHTSEMMEAVADFADAEYLEEGSRNNSPQELVSMCENLVFIDRDGYFRSSHESVRMYLDEPANEQSSPLKEYQRRKVGIHQRLADRCLSYVLLEDFSIEPPTSSAQLTRLSKRFPFLKYAAANWGRHLALAEKMESNTLLSRILDSPYSLRLSLQMWYLEHAKKTAFEAYLPYSSPLNLVSLFGLHQIANQITAEGLLQTTSELLCASLDFALLGKQLVMAKWILLRIEETDEWLPSDKIREVIHASAKNGWECIMFKTLSKNRGFVSSKLHPNGPSPLIVACQAGHIGVAEILIDHGADINQIEGSQLAPLLIAARNTDREMLKFLLKKGAKTDCRDETGKTPLHYAVLAGSESSPYALINESDYDLFAARRASATSLLIGSPLASPRRGLPLPSPLHGPPLVSPQAVAEFGLTRSVILLLHHRAPLNAQAADGCTPMHYAVKQKSFSIVKILLEFPCDLDIRDNNGDNAIHLASSNGSFQILSHILRSLGPEVRRKIINVPGNWNSTALHRSIWQNQSQMAKFLLDEGADPTAIDSRGCNPLLLTARSGMVDLIRPLLESTRNPNCYDTKRNTVLHLAAEYNQLEYMKNFLQVCAEAGLDVNLSAANDSKASPLHVALNHSHEDIAKFLIENGARSDPDVNGEYPLHFAAKKGLKSIVQLLLSQSTARIEDNSGETPLLEAAFYGHVSTIESLMPHYDLSEKNKLGVTPLAAALSQRHFKMVDFILNHGVDPTKIVLEGLGPLHAAAKFGDIQLVQRLAEAGCRDDADGPFQLKPSHCAAFSGKVDIIDTLKDKGYDTVNAINAIGERCRDIAAQIGDLKMLKHLDALGAEQGAKSRFGWSTGFKAIDKGHLDVLKYLLEMDEELGDADICGNTPLIMATYRGYGKIVEYLIGIQPSTVDIYNCFGNSPLSIAASSNNVKIVETLLEAGANPYLEDAFGMNAFDYAALGSDLSQVIHSAHYLEGPVESDWKHQVTRVSLHKYCRQILSFSRDLDVAEQYKRCRLVFALHDVLLQLGDDESSEVCLLDACWPQGQLELRQRRICHACERKMLSRDMYHCRSRGHLAVLCPRCYENYRQEKKKIPNAYKELWKLERDVQVVRAALPDDLKLDEIYKALHYFQCSVDWSRKLQSRYGAWMKKYNSTGRYSILKRPGHEFLKILQRAHDFFLDFQLGSIDITNSQQLQDMEMDFRENERDHPAEREIINRECDGLDFVKVSAETRKQRMSLGIDLDPQNGRLTPAFLENLMKKYPMSDHKNFPDLEILHWNPSANFDSEAFKPTRQVERVDGGAPSAAFESEPLSRAPTIFVLGEPSRGDLESSRDLQKRVAQKTWTEELFVQHLHRSDTSPGYYQHSGHRWQEQVSGVPLGEKATKREPMTSQKSSDAKSPHLEAARAMVLRDLRTRRQEIKRQSAEAARRRTEVLGDPQRPENRIRWYAVMLAEVIKPGSQEDLLFEVEQGRKLGNC